jgi:hypothetical protein
MLSHLWVYCWNCLKLQANTRNSREGRGGGVRGKQNRFLCGPKVSLQLADRLHFQYLTVGCRSIMEHESPVIRVSDPSELFDVLEILGSGYDF